MQIGILSLQGDFHEHGNMLTRLKVTPVEVRTPSDLKNIDGLIIPGGESTTIGKLATDYKLIDPIKKLITKGFPVWGTCAGMILVSNHIYATFEDFQKDNPSTQPSLGGMESWVVRNAFGRQIDSMEYPIIIEEIKDSKTQFKSVFIRAPLIAKVGENVEVLARVSMPRVPESTQDHRPILDSPSATHKGTPAMGLPVSGHPLPKKNYYILAARQRNIFVTAFHPELTEDTRVHEYFVGMIKKTG